MCFHVPNTLKIDIKVGKLIKLGKYYTTPICHFFYFMLLHHTVEATKSRDSRTKTDLGVRWGMVVGSGGQGWVGFTIDSTLIDIKDHPSVTLRPKGLLIPGTQ